MIRRSIRTLGSQIILYYLGFPGVAAGSNSVTQLKKYLAKIFKKFSKLQKFEKKTPKKVRERFLKIQKNLKSLIKASRKISNAKKMLKKILKS